MAPTGTSAYRRMVHIDEERGPLVQAQQIMQADIITIRAADDGTRLADPDQASHPSPVLDDSRQLVGTSASGILLTAPQPRR